MCCMVGGMRWRLLVAVACAACWLAPVRMARAEEQLCFKDGVCQPVKSYEVVGDRVRYYSLDRSAWEEVPASIVDFEAMKKADEAEAAAHEEEREAARKLDLQRFDKAENTGFEIAPGVRLPGDQGVFAYDGLRVVRINQSSPEIVTDKKRAVLALAIPGPLVKNRAFVILPGVRSPIRVMSTQPTFYVQWSDGLGANMALISIKPRKENRQVESVEWRAGLGKPAELHEAVPLERTEIAPTP